MSPSLIEDRRIPDEGAPRARVRDFLFSIFNEWWAYVVELISCGFYENSFPTLPRYNPRKTQMKRNQNKIKPLDSNLKQFGSRFRDSPKRVRKYTTYKGVRVYDRSYDDREGARSYFTFIYEGTIDEWN